MQATVLSPELRYIVDRALAAREIGDESLADVFGRAAERYVVMLAPELAGEISAFASRKGSGAQVASRLATKLSADLAAAVAIVWLLRRARSTGIDTLSYAFLGNATFEFTLRTLCHRAIVRNPNADERSARG